MVVRGVVAARRRPCLTPGRQPQVTRAARLLRPTQATAAHEAPVALVSARARRLSAPAGVRARPSPFPRTGGATLPCFLSRIAASLTRTRRRPDQPARESTPRINASWAPENRGGIEISHFLAAYQRVESRGRRTARGPPCADTRARGGALSGLATHEGPPPHLLEIRPRLGASGARAARRHGACRQAPRRRTGRRRASRGAAPNSPAPKPVGVWKYRIR